MTARTDAPGRGELAFLGVGVLGVAAMAATGAGVLTVVLLPFLASVVLALLGQATAWLWVLVAVSGIGLSWAEGDVALGPWAINIAGLQWGLTFVLGGILLVLLPRTGQKWPAPFRWYAAFVAVAAVGVLRGPDLFYGVKNAIQYAAPLIVGLVVLRTARVPERIVALRGSLWVALVLSAIVAVASLPWLTLTGEFTGVGAALGTRTTAIFLIPMYALALAAWRVRGTGYALIALAVFAMMVLTLSRTVTAVALVLLAVALMWDAGWPARARAVALVVLLATLALSFAPLRERMLGGRQALTSMAQPTVEVSGEGRDAGLEFGNIALSGRGVLWLQTWRHAVQAPIAGHGTGSSEYFLDTRQFVASHPHNDYLRVFHDAGVIGLGVMLAMAVAGLAALRRLQRSSVSLLGRELSFAAFLSWLAYLMIAVTDNIFVYVSFFTQNLFLLIALAYLVIERETPPGVQP